MPRLSGCDKPDHRSEGERATMRGPGPRHSILDLAPLELECMTALWLLDEGTVREIRQQLELRRPRAYTTVLTIMDRLAEKGIVERRKVGRAFRYRAHLSADEARLKAVEKIVECFFGGSVEALASHLASRCPEARSLAQAPAQSPAQSGDPLMEALKSPGAKSALRGSGEKRL